MSVPGGGNSGTICPCNVHPLMASKILERDLEPRRDRRRVIAYHDHVGALLGVDWGLRCRARKTERLEDEVGVGVLGDVVAEMDTVGGEMAGVLPWRTRPSRARRRWGAFAEVTG